MKREQTDLFDINKNNLDEEWVKQPEQYHQAADELVDARDAYERAQAELKVIEAELDSAIRQDPTQFGLEKVTETALERVIIRQRRFVKAQEEMFRAKHVMGLCQVEVSTLDHRKTALENLTKLRLADYFSEPRPPKEDRERLQAAERNHAFRKRAKSEKEG